MRWGGVSQCVRVCGVGWGGCESVCMRVCGMGWGGCESVCMRVCGMGWGCKSEYEDV